MAGDNVCTWHAGESSWRGVKWCNNFTLGVEFEGDTNKVPLTQNQIDSFIEWFNQRKDRYSWAKEDITDHRQISPGRKVDLSPAEFKRVISHL